MPSRSLTERLLLLRGIDTRQTHFVLRVPLVEDCDGIAVSYANNAADIRLSCGNAGEKKAEEC